MVRSGDEPAHARSPLRLRLALALFGVTFSLVAAAVGLERHEAIGAVAFGAVALVAAADAAVVLRRIRQGPHWQPGRDVPPYRPAPDVPRPRRPRRQPSASRRQRVYLAMMGTCVAMITLAWTVVRLWSVFAAGVLSVVAMLIPPVAAVMANAGWTDRQDPPRDR